MVGKTHTGKAECVVCLRTHDRKVLVNQTVGKAETEFVHCLGVDGVVVGNDQAAIVLAIDVIRQQRVYGAGLACLGEQVFPAESGIYLMIACKVVIQPDVKAIRTRRSGLQHLVVVAVTRNVRQRIISVEQIL